MYKKILSPLLAVALMLLLFVNIKPVGAATLLSDDFTGTTIDTAKWNELDASGAGGTSGNVQQNGSLTVANSFTASTWGQTALYSKDTFDSTGLEVQALLAPTSDTLLGYGDYNFQSTGTSAFIVDIQAGGNTLALSWTNGGFDGATSCGSDTATKTYKIKIVSGGFEVYKNGTLLCTHSTSVTITNKAVFLEAAAAAATFDDVLVTGTAVLTEPGAPTSLVADPGSTQVGLVWSAPASNGGSAITDYIVQYKLSSEPTTWTTFADGTSTTTTATVTGLTNSSSYDFRVKAVNTIGTGTASSTVTATPTAPTVPGAPTGVGASPGNTQVSLSWTAPVVTGGSPITDYKVEYKLATEPTTWTLFVDGVSTTTSAIVTGLTNGLSYNFRISTINAVGTGTPSATGTATPVSIGNVLTDSFTGTTIDTNKWTEVDPLALGGTTGKVQQNGSLSITDSYTGGQWGGTALVSNETFNATNLEISADIVAGSSPLLGYGDYLFGDINSKAYLLYITSPGSGILALTWSLGSYESVSCGTASAGVANYKMKIISGGFEVYKDDVKLCTATTSVVINNKPVFMENASTASTFDNLVVYGTASVHTVPDAPTIGTATPDNHAASVTFTAPSNNGGAAITSYTVTSSPGGFTNSGSSSPITVSGLTNGTSYTFTVTATNSVGTSTPSAASNSVTPNPPAAPDQVTGVEATGVNQQVLLNWAVPGIGGAAISDYIVQYKLSSADSWTTFNDGTSTANKTIVTGLVNGSAYDFKVSAVNSGGTGTASTPVSASPKEISTLAFVITGESNSGGIGPNADATSQELAPHHAVQITNLTSGSFLYEDLDIGTNNLRDHDGLGGYYDTSHGFELQLANVTEANAWPDNPLVYLTKTGHGGSQVAQWTVGNGSGYWTKFLQRINAAKTQLPTDRQWVVWMSLGINDSIAGTPTSTWKTAMIAHINKIKAELPGAIIIMTEFQSMPAGSGYPAYNAVMDEIAASQANVFTVDSTGAGTDGANHWLYAGLKTMVNRMTTVTQNALGLVYPGKPTSLNVTPSGTSASLSWTAPVASGTSSITDYKVEYKLASASTWTVFADGTSTSTTANVTGLTGATNYNFRVSAVNSSGAGNAVTTSSSTTDATAPVISNDGVASMDPSNTAVTITWDTDELASSMVEYGLTTAYGRTTAEADTSPRVLNHSVELTSLLPCAVYHFRVKSNDANSNLAVGSDIYFQTDGCTAGVTDTHESTIDTTVGGTLELVTGSKSIGLGVPAGATGSDANFQIKKVISGDALVATGIPTGFILSGDHTYDLKAFDDVDSSVTSFSEPITITISYSNSDVVGIDESSLVIYHYSGGIWTPLSGCVVNTSANTITCTTSSFSFFALFGTAKASGGTTSGSFGYHPVGTNIIDSTGTIYTLTADGKRRPYTSAGAYLSYGFNTWLNVVPARSADLTLSVGSFIPPRDGSIVCSDRGTDKGTCYLITGGKKAGFTSGTVFKGLGFSFTNALYGDVSFMETTNNIATVDEAHRMGVLINNKGTLQIVGDNSLIGIPSMDVLASWGYNTVTSVLANAKDTLYSQTKVLATRLAGVLGY